MIPSPVLIGSVGQFHKDGTDDSSNLSPFIKKLADPGDGGTGVDGGGRGRREGGHACGWRQYPPPHTHTHTHKGQERDE